LAGHINLNHLEYQPLKSVPPMALEFMHKYAVKPHDALHIACMISNNLPIMVTQDPDFKSIKEIEVLTISEFLARV